MKSSLRARGVLIFTVLLALSLTACSDGGNGHSRTATISGSVSGTTIMAVNDSGDIIASYDTAGMTPDVDVDGDSVNESYSFTLTGIPLNVNIRLYLVTGDGVYPLYFDGGSGTPDTNIFSFTSKIDIDLGFVDTDMEGQEGKAIPENNPVDTPEVNPEGEDSDIIIISGATINDFAGTWEGNVFFHAEDGEATTDTITLNLIVSGDLLVGTVYCPEDGATANITGTVTNGVFTFDLPAFDIEVDDPDCANFDVSVTATLDANLTTMSVNGSGIFCGDSGSFSGSLTKTGS